MRLLTVSWSNQDYGRCNDLVGRERVDKAKGKAASKYYSNLQLDTNRRFHHPTPLSLNFHNA